MELVGELEMWVTVSLKQNLAVEGVGGSALISLSLSLTLVSDTALVKCSAHRDEVQEQTEEFVSNNPQKYPRCVSKL